MVFDNHLAERVGQILKNKNLVEKKMFGGVGFLINGNMACGVHGDNLIVRVGNDQYQKLLSHPSVKPFDLTGKPMTGWAEVIPTGTSDDKELEHWVRLGVEFACTLPPKQS